MSEITCPCGKDLINADDHDKGECLSCRNHERECDSVGCNFKLESVHERINHRCMECLYSDHEEHNFQVEKEMQLL